MQTKKLTVKLTFSQAEVKISHTLYGVELSLLRGQILAQSGAPGFPIRIEEVAIPEGMEVSRITARVIKTIPLTDRSVFVAPVRGEKIVPTQPGMEVRRQSVWVPPDPLLYEEVKKDIARRTAWYTASRVEGTIFIAGIAVRPIRCDKFDRLELVTELDITVSLRAIIKKHPRILRAETRPEWCARRYNVIGRQIINPEIVKKLHKSAITAVSKDSQEGLFDVRDAARDDLSPPIVDYLIITDNYSWDANLIKTIQYVGDLCGTFQRLADWKTDRGLRTHVACISNIVNGSYGDFTSGARDLQEVLRNFLKYFVKDHYTDYLLLGGVVDIIPVREVCGGNVYGCIDFVASKTPPAKSAASNIPLGENTLMWNGTFLGMRVDKGEFGDQNNHTLTMLDSGQIIPYDSNGPNGTISPRWYHTTDETFSTFSNARTNFIRVDGSPDVINGKVQWYKYENLIPTDLYYGSLYSPTYDIPGKHDWDLLDNGLYGQWSETENLDGIDYYSDVYIGRAPVKNVAEANIFIDKVIAYECAPDRPADARRFNRMLLVGDHLSHIRVEGQISRSAGDQLPPQEKKYSYDAINNRAVMHVPVAKEGVSFFLYSHVTGDDFRFIPYKSEASPGNKGWFYIENAHAISPSVISGIPNPTEWIAVYSDDKAELTPKKFLLDEKGLDPAIRELEDVHQLVDQSRPSINEVHRLYSYEPDFFPWIEEFGSKNAYLWLLDAQALEDELNDGPHLVCMVGHGWKGGCCQYGEPIVDSLTNGDRTFIIFADSCFTNEFNLEDTISRYSLIAPNGGAVAYIGYSRYSVGGVGYHCLLNFVRRAVCGDGGIFFKERSPLGALSSAYLCYLSEENAGFRWSEVAQNLMGDPEMPIYKDAEDLRIKYVANTNTMELHERSCQWVQHMWVGHRLYFEEKEEALSQGFDGCGFCLREHHTH